MTQDEVYNIVTEELSRAMNRFQPYNSYHEGYAVIKEELDELWEEIKGGQNPAAIKAEATQVATTAIRFILDLFAE